MNVFMMSQDPDAFSVYNLK